ncbi:hypothetical protein ACHHYP_04310 [Achlya hypogyna]|uniref:RRM domain-containing protein n=1 Tax=Achlya hypogyna TaxID=1202772 RepID=A0A1V9Z1F1_ACHHY|nr:hypothetical protein ACHHYP_04310 [Achlya hypogyna]
MTDAADCKTLWMGDIQINWDEAFIGSLFQPSGQAPSVKLIRDKTTGYPAGYGFLEFESPSAAQAALEALNGQLIPNTPHRFRLNWGGRRFETVEDYSIFVGDLASDVTDDALFATFSVKFASVRGAKVVVDQMTRVAKGFGFVRFGVKAEADQALQTMQGVPCLGRPMRVSAATDRPKYTPSTPSKPPNSPSPTPEDDSNTTVFVGGLDPSVSEDDLRKQFSSIGHVVGVKIPPGRGCGFVQYSTRALAEQAITEMSGVLMGQTRLRCAWGRPSQTMARAPPSTAFVFPSPSPPQLYGYPPYQYYGPPYPHGFGGYASPHYAGYSPHGYMYPYMQQPAPLPEDDSAGQYAGQM